MVFSQYVSHKALTMFMELLIWETGNYLPIDPVVLVFHSKEQWELALWNWYGRIIHWNLMWHSAGYFSLLMKAAILVEEGKFFYSFEYYDINTNALPR